MRGFVFGLLLPALLLADQVFQLSIDRLNPTEQDYPGGRGPNQLVVYTAEFGDSTGTNQYGIEAIVQDGQVVFVGKNNSPIPANGFVISGHGSKVGLILQRLFPGVQVQLKGKQLICRINAQSFLRYGHYFLKQAENNLAQFAQHASVVQQKETLQQRLHELQQQWNTLQHETKIDSVQAQQFLSACQTLFYRTFPSETKEVRAVWFRIKDKNAQQLEQTVRQMKELGFNMLCPEVIYGGYAIYPNAHPDLPQNPNFVGWDPLAELVRLSQKYRLKLVPWVWVFFVGRENSPLVKSKGQWLAVSRQGKHVAETEPGYIFFCPARDAVHAFWLEVYQTLLSRYKVDGLQLDYIRYPGSLPVEKGFCYCEHCRRQFTLDYLMDPLSIDPESEPEIWRKWQLFREKQVNRFVAKVHRLLKSNFPQVKLSADVFPDLKESRQVKMQNWAYWLKKGYLQEIFTMSYTPDENSVKKGAQFLKQKLPIGTAGYVGLGPFLQFSGEILLKEIQHVRQAGLDGVCLFNFNSLSQEHKRALKLGAFRLPAELKTVKQ